MEYERDRPVIEVTPAMIEAGWSVVNECVELGADIDQEWLVRCYSEMRALAPHHS